jgi:hypothetical protein
MRSSFLRAAAIAGILTLMTSPVVAQTAQQTAGALPTTDKNVQKIADALDIEADHITVWKVSDHGYDHTYRVVTRHGEKYSCLIQGWTMVGFKDYGAANCRPAAED